MTINELAILDESETQYENLRPAQSRLDIYQSGQLQLTLWEGYSLEKTLINLQSRPIEFHVHVSSQQHMTIHMNMPYGLYFRYLRDFDVTVAHQMIDKNKDGYKKVSLYRENGETFRIWLASKGTVQDIDALRKNPIIITYKGGHIVEAYTPEAWYAVKTEVDRRIPNYSGNSNLESLTRVRRMINWSIPMRGSLDELERYHVNLNKYIGECEIQRGIQQSVETYREWGALLYMLIIRRQCVERIMKNRQQHDHSTNDEEYDNEAFQVKGRLQIFKKLLFRQTKHKEQSPSLS